MMDASTQASSSLVARRLVKTSQPWLSQEPQSPMAQPLAHPHPNPTTNTPFQRSRCLRMKSRSERTGMDMLPVSI
jgi:hypothetical protein